MTISSILLTAIRDTSGGWPPSDVVLGSASSAALLWMGMRSWKGRAMPYRPEGYWSRGPVGHRGQRDGMRLYRTRMGSGFTYIPCGIGIAILTTGEITRQIFGFEPGGLLASTTGYLGGAMVLVSFLWAGVYFAIGIPDWMRPPAQRGWENTKEDYVLARPEARVVDDFERAQIERERQEAERRARNRAARTAELDAWATGDDPWKDHDPWN